MRLTGRPVWAPTIEAVQSTEECGHAATEAAFGDLGLARLRFRFGPWPRRDDPTVTSLPDV
jgi:hypothetical protein